MALLTALKTFILHVSVLLADRPQGVLDLDAEDHIERAPDNTAATDTQDVLFHELLSPMSFNSLAPLTDPVLEDKMLAHCADQGLDCSLAVEYRKFCFNKGRGLATELEKALGITASGKVSKKDQCDKGQFPVNVTLSSEKKEFLLPCGRFYVCNRNSTLEKVVLSKDGSEKVVLSSEHETEEEKCAGSEESGRSGLDFNVMCLPDFYTRSSVTKRKANLPTQWWGTDDAQPTEQITSAVKAVMVKEFLVPTAEQTEPPMPPAMPEIHPPGPVASEPDGSPDPRPADPEPADGASAGEPVGGSDGKPETETTCVCDRQAETAVNVKNNLLVGINGDKPGHAPTIPNAAQCACTGTWYKRFGSSITNLFTGSKDICGAARTLYWVPDTERDNLIRTFYMTPWGGDPEKRYAAWVDKCREKCSSAPLRTISEECSPPDSN